jgi:hypothetical protein
LATPYISPIVATRITIASHTHQCLNDWSLTPARIPVTTIPASPTYIGIVVSPESVIRSRIFFRSRSPRIRYRTLIEVPCAPRNTSTDRMWRNRIHW